MLGELLRACPSGEFETQACTATTDRARLGKVPPVLCLAAGWDGEAVAARCGAAAPPGLAVRAGWGGTAVLPAVVNAVPHASAHAYMRAS